MRILFRICREFENCFLASHIGFSPLSLVLSIDFQELNMERNNGMRLCTLRRLKKKRILPIA
jgi:hypothetical protein